MIRNASAVWLHRALISALCLAPLIVAADTLKTVFLAKSRVSAIPSKRVSEAVAALRKPNDPIVIAPSAMSTDVFFELGEQSGPVDWTLVDPDGHPRAIEIARGSARNAQTSSWNILEQRTVGHWVVRALANPSPRLNRQDLLANFRAGEVNVNQGPAGSIGNPCQWLSTAELALPPSSQLAWTSKDRFSCRPEPDGFVGVVVAQDRKGVARRCLWVWPLTNAIRITWPSAAAGGSLHISGGIPRGFDRIDSLVEMRVLGERRFSNNRGFVDIDVPTPSRAEGAGELTLEVSQKLDATSPVCLEASIR
jgi:hypothetical protein